MDDKSYQEHKMVLNMIEKLEKIEKILEECADWHDDTCHALDRIEQIVKE